MAELILLRHGQSVLNKKNVFTGWVDVPLSREGITEAFQAGEKLADIEFDIVYTSLQMRSIETALIALSVNNIPKVPVIIHETGKMAEWSTIYSESMQESIIPVYRDWHLNERYYGKLQGQNKADVAKAYGEQQVRQWRRSHDVPPPGGESLKDTAERTLPFLKERVLEALDDDKNILLSAHGNSLRSIVMFIDNLGIEEVLRLEIPTGRTLFYEYRNHKLEKNNRKST